MEKSLPWQEVSSRQVLAADRLEVQEIGSFVSVSFVTVNGDLVKQVNYRIEDVREYVLEEVIWERDNA